MKLALSFDDGPNAGTATVAYQLAYFGIKASFFECGGAATTMPAYPASLLSQGHEIGNHSWSHPDLTSLSFADAYFEIERTQIQLGYNSGRLPRIWRPPYGQTSNTIDDYASSIGLRKVLWNVDPWSGRTTDPTGPEVAQHLVDNAADGAIILLHEARPPVWEGIATAVPALKQRGYEFVKASALA